MSERDAEIRRLLDEWNRADVERDVGTAERLRDPSYRSHRAGGAILTRAEELSLLASGDFLAGKIDVHDFKVRYEQDRAVVESEHYLEGSFRGVPVTGHYKQQITFERRNSSWVALSSVVREASFTEGSATQGGKGAKGRFKRAIPAAARRWLKQQARRVVSWANPSFQEIAYLPYRPGEDYVLPRPDAVAGQEHGLPLPLPPKDLWLGYNYPVHGKLHVDRMIEIVANSGFDFDGGGRILDLGCGAGRMIRHLEPLSNRFEIWGADISAAHIFWCKQHLSPPFHFATTTKVPHLPFEDRSFDFIYCGSLFTHIDDLAEAWLLELRRLLATDGRLYVTVHDNHTIDLFENTAYGRAAIVQEIRGRAAYGGAKASFGMFTLGRDDQSQVFYHEDYLRKMVGGMFDILSVTKEAYFYQTAYLLRRKSGSLR